MKRTPRDKKSKSDYDILYKKVWKLFSEFIRRTSKGRCFTCDTKYPWRKLNAGHFIHNSLDFDEINVHGQCSRCNRFLHGNAAVYAIKLVEIHGIRKIKALIKKAHKGELPTKRQLQYKFRKYTKLLEDLR